MDTRNKSGLKTTAFRFLLSAISCCAVIQSAQATEEFFVPLPEDETLSFLRGIYSEDSCTTAVTSAEPIDPINTVTDFVVRVEGTLIVVDHHEDGYESNIEGIVDEFSPIAPDQATTRIYGDSNVLNGAAPGVTTDAEDVLIQGQVVVFEESFDTGFNTTSQLGDVEIDGAGITGGGTRTQDGLDGGDRVFTTETINLTRSQWADGPGTLLAGAFELFPTSQWGDSFTLPVGENSGATEFEWTGLTIMAANDNTSVSVDVDGNGEFGDPVDINGVIDRGQTITVSGRNDDGGETTGGLNQGARVSSSDIVQVNVVSGSECVVYGTRWFTLFPDALLGNNYYEPVSTPVGDDTVIYLYNPALVPITINFETVAGMQPAINVSAQSVFRQVMPSDSGARFFTGTNATFGAFTVTDEGEAVHDWGHASTSERLMGNIVQVGFAEGDDPSRDDEYTGGGVGENGSPIWLIADNLVDTNDTEFQICVDVQGNGGPNTDPNTGLEFDFTFLLNRLESVRVYDGGENPNLVPAHIDDDQSGMQIFVCDGSDAILAAAWGQDPENASVGIPAIDVGTTVRSVSAGVAFAGDTIFEDINGNGFRDPGEPGIQDVTVLLTPPPGINLGNGPGRPISAATDFNGSYLFPSLIDSSYTIEVIPPSNFTQTADPDTNNGNIEVLDNQTVMVIADSSGRLDQDFGYQNNVTVGDVGDFIYNDTNGNGIQDSGEVGIAGIDVQLCSIETVSNSAMDDFSTIAFDNNSAQWAGDWFETGDLTDFTGLPAGSNAVNTADTNAGNTQFTGAGNPGPSGLDGVRVLAEAGGVLSLGGNANQPSVTRAVNVVGPGIITVEFNFNGTVNAGDDVELLMSTDGGATFPTVLQTFSQAVQDNGQIAISFDPGSATTAFFRFQTVSATALLDDFDLFLIDSISISTSSLSETSCQTQTTDGTGFYTFSGVSSGLRSIRVLNPPAGLINTDDPGGDDDSANIFLLTDSGGNLEQDFGYFEPATVIGHVYLDENGNGVQDITEPNVANLNVEVTDSSGDLIVVQTDANGDYNVEVPAGNTQINLDTTDPQFPTGFIQTDGQDPSAVVAVAGITVDAGDDGFFQGNIIGDTIYAEIDGVSGVQDGIDPGITGVAVSLTPPVTVDLGAGLGVAISTTTDSNGEYSFVGLPDGQYTVQVTQPSGSTQTQDPDGGNDNQSVISVFGGSDFNDQDFGYQNNVTAGEVGDTVYDDVNGNGIQDVGELGLANINVEICGDLDDDNNTANTCREQLTDVNGNYLFGDGAAGGAAIPVSDVGEVYTITILTPPAGETNSQDPDGGLPNFAQLSLSSAGGNLDQDFGYFQPGLVTGHLYIDSNGDGTQQVGEPDLAGVDVVVTDDNGNQTVVATDIDGNYSASVAPGTNVVVDIDETDPQFPANHTQTEGTDPSVVTVVAGGSVNAGEDGFAPAGAISGVIFFDQATIGTYEPGSDIGATAVIVTLLPPSGVDLGNGSGVSITTTTDLNGNYSFGPLPDGSYAVSVSQPNNTNATVDPNESGLCVTCDNSSTVVISSGTVVDDQNFGYQTIVPSGQIGNIIFSDSNGNGVFDSGESGLEGIIVELCGDLDDNNTVTCRSEVTGANGQYLFGDGFLADGVTADADDIGLPGTTGTEDYIVSILNPPAGLSNTADPDGGVSSVAQLTLPSAISNLDQNFGYVAQRTISGTVWLDEDLDGILDTEEVGITQSQVSLLENGLVIATTVSDANGHYAFDGILPGDYTIEVDEATLPAGLTNTAGTGAGGLDPNPKSILLSVNQNIEDVNFGYVPNTGTGAIGDRVWSDANGNGVQDLGEAGIEGVVLRLLDDLGAQIATTTSNANGDYLFTDVAFATGLTVSIDSADTALIGYSPSEGTDSQGGFTSEPIQLRSGFSITTDIDFGFNDPLSNSITETVWFDDDADGVFDSTENAIEAVFFNLFNDVDGNGIADDADNDGQPEVVATSRSDASGLISFTGIADGSYVVAVADSGQVLDGLIGTTAPAQAGISNSISVSSAASINQQSFGFNSPGLIAGTVYVDTSGNSDQESTEAGLAGIVVTLIPPVDVDLGNGVGQPITTVTESDGRYSFSVLPNQTYTVTVASPGGTETEDPDGGFDNTASVTVSSGESSTTNNFGYTGLTSVFDIAGTVFFDNDSDGILDASKDAGIEAVTVELIDLNNINVYDILSGLIDLNADGVITSTDDGSVEGVDIIDGMFDIDSNGSIDEADSGSIGQFEVLAGMISLAQAGTANQSSTLGSFNANNGIDGDTLDFAHTDDAIANPTTATEYWQVDLGASVDIADITVFNRDTVCCVGRLEGVVLMVADTPFPDASSDFAGALSNADFVQVLSVASVDDPFVPIGLSGRFIRLQKAGGNMVNGVVIENFGNGAIPSGSSQLVINFAELKVTPSFIPASTDGVITTVTSDVNGDYSFTGLVAGNYRVAVTDERAQLAGYDLTSGLNQREIVVSTANIDDVDFGYVVNDANASISGEVFIDSDSDDIADDPETNLPNVDVYLCRAPLLADGVTAPDNVVSFERYTGSFSVAADLDGGTLTSSTTTDVFGLLAGDNGDQFGYIYRGFITLSEAGDYQFSTRSDDGSVVLINGELVVDNDGGHAPATVTNTVTFAPSTYSLEVRYFEQGGGEVFSFSYLTPSEIANSQSLGAIPSSILSTVSDVCNPQHPNFVAQQVADANGEYVFNNLPAAQYVVANDPNDIQQGLEQSTPELIVNVTQGEDVRDVDIGHEEETDTGLLSGFVWTDTDGNGEFDSGEVPIAGVTINVFENDGSTVATAVTDSSGNWIVANLSGVQLSSTLLVGYDEAVPAALNLVATQPTNFPLNESQYFPIDISSPDNRQASSLDFGFQPDVGANLGSISGVLYSDIDQNNAYLASTDGELSNVTLNLFNSSGDLVSSVRTDDSGNYSFSSLQDDTYSIEVSDINNVTRDLNPNLDVIDASITINAGNLNVIDQNAGFISNQITDQLSIGNKFFFDANNNGQFDDGESGVEGVVIQCWLDVDQSETVNNAGAASSTVVPQPGVDNLIRTVVTDQNGDYICPSLPVGQYIIRVFDAGEFNETDDGAVVSGSDADNQAKNWSYALALTATEPNFSADFAIAGDNSISGFVVIEDMDLVEPLLDDGLIQAGVELDGVRGGPSNDIGAGGVPVDLLVDQNGTQIVLASTVTASDGSYTFTSLPDGDYQVVVRPDGSIIDGFGQTGDPSLDPSLGLVLPLRGGADNGEEDLVCDSPTASLCDDQSEVFTLNGGTTVTDLDFAYQRDFATTPVTMTYFSSTGGNGAIEFNWETENEIGHAGFQIYARIDGQWQLISDLIGSKPGSALMVRQYHYQVNDIDAIWFALIDVSSQEEVTPHGPFRLGEEYGGNTVELEPYDWSQINLSEPSKDEISNAIDQRLLPLLDAQERAQRLQ